MVKQGNSYGNDSYQIWFFSIFLYLLIDYGRLQTFLSLSVLRPGMLVTLLLIYFAVCNNKIGELISLLQIKYTVYFVVLLSLYIPFAINNFHAYEATKTMALVIPVMLSITVVVNSKDRLINLLRFFAGLLVFMAGYSLTHGGHGPGGITTDENDMCLFLVTFLPFIFFLLLQAKTKKAKLFFAGIVCLGFLSIAATFSRGGFVGLLGLIGVYWLFSKKKIVFLFVALSLIGVLFIAGGNEYKTEMSTVIDVKDRTANSRLLSWQASWDMFMDNPFGVGGHNFPVHFPEYQSIEMTRNMWGRAAHSLWFTLMPETGIIGIFIYFVIIIANIKDLFFLMHFEDANGMEGVFFQQFAVVSLASLAGFFASASFLSVLYYPEFWHITALIVAVRKVAGDELKYVTAGKQEAYG